MRISKAEKELLQQAFRAPEPKKKRAFLHKMPRQELRIGTLLLSQAAYIRKWVWGVSLLLSLVLVLLAGYVGMDMVWVLSALMPFAALLIIMEFARSSAYGMAELEMTSRFSLRTILLARMVMLGAVQLFGLLLASPFLGTLLLRNGVYLLVPYLLTAMLGLMVVRRLSGKEGMYACGSISACVCVICPMSGQLVPAMYESENVALWVLAAVLLLLGLIKEYKKTMNHLEEFSWN